MEPGLMNQLIIMFFQVLRNSGILFKGGFMNKDDLAILIPLIALIASLFAIAIIAMSE